MIQTQEDYHKALETLWQEYTQADIPLTPNVRHILERKYAVPRYLAQADLLITGINPSFNEKVDTKGVLPYSSVQETLDNENLPNSLKAYWKTIWKLVPCTYKKRFIYVDLFGVREKRQQLMREFKNPVELDFLAQNMYLTQQLIENVIRPKLIVVTNKATWAYWGYSPKVSWMGYKYKIVRELRKNVILAEIEGLDMNKTDMVTPPELREQRRWLMKGTKVLFARYQSYACPQEEQITADEILHILETECR